VARSRPARAAKSTAGGRDNAVGLTSILDRGQFFYSYAKVSYLVRPHRRVNHRVNLGLSGLVHEEAHLICLN